MKPGLARAPVEVQILGQEGADDQAAAVVHPARGEQLAHRGVDHRVAGAARAPGVEPLRVVVPFEAVVVALVGVAGVAGVVEQHVRVEVAPGELAHERVRARAAALARALLEAARRDAPEVQVRRQL